MKIVLFFTPVVFLLIMGMSGAADFDGDGTDDIGIFRPSSGLWSIRGISRIYFGSSNDSPIPGDYNGNGTTEAAIFRSTNGLWAVKGLTRIYYGTENDIALNAVGSNATQYGNFVAGDSKHLDAELSYYTCVARATFGQGGTVRFTFQLWLDSAFGANGTAYAQIRRNGSVVSEYSTGYYESIVEDISGWQPGDICELWLRLEYVSGEAVSSNVREFTIKTGPGPSIVIEEGPYL